MAIALGVIVIAGLVLLIVGAETGRLRMNACCGVADPRRDLRMRAAFGDEPDGPTQPRSVSPEDRS